MLRSEEALNRKLDWSKGGISWEEPFGWLGEGNVGLFNVICYLFIVVIIIVVLSLCYFSAP
jgi:hypothetical protein